MENASLSTQYNKFISTNDGRVNSVYILQNQSYSSLIIIFKDNLFSQKSRSEGLQSIRVDKSQNRQTVLMSSSGNNIDMSGN